MHLKRCTRGKTRVNFGSALAGFSLHTRCDEIRCSHAHRAALESGPAGQVARVGHLQQGRQQGVCYAAKQTCGEHAHYPALPTSVRSCPESTVPLAACAQLGRAELAHKISVLHGLERKASVLMAGEHKKLPAHMDIDDLKEVRAESGVRSRMCVRGVRCGCGRVRACVHAHASRCCLVEPSTSNK